MKPRLWGLPEVLPWPSGAQAEAQAALQQEYYKMRVSMLAKCNHTWHDWL